MEQEMIPPWNGTCSGKHRRLWGKRAVQIGKPSETARHKAMGATAIALATAAGKTLPGQPSRGITLHPKLAKKGRKQ